MLCDSDRNIMASLRHEACEAHCDECGTCLYEKMTYCPDCEPDE